MNSNQHQPSPVLETLITDGFKVAVSDEPLKVQNLKEPLIGIYEAKTNSKHSPVYMFATSDGKKVRLLGNTRLNSLMSNVPIGSTVYVEYTGPRALRKGNTIYPCNVAFKESAY